jgi:hypothetical protein
MVGQEVDSMKHWKPILAAAAVCILALGSYAVVNYATSPPQITVPSGTRIQVRLDQGINSAKNSPGDQFTASLNDPLVIDGKLLAPSGSTVTGQLTQVKESGRIKGRASLTMVLRRLTVQDDDYNITTRPLTLVARSTKKRDALIIGGTAVLGTLVGAAAGGAKGAAIGLGIGGGSGTGFVLATKGREVVYGPEARFTFTLTEPLRLPARTPQKT